MTKDRLKTGVEPSVEMSCKSNKPQTTDNGQHSIGIRLKPA
jgi:hypothetical protein